MIRRFVVGFALILSGCGIHGPSINNAGNDLLRRGQMDASLRDYQLAQVSEPDDPIPYYNAGIALLESEEYGRAEVTLLQALRLAADDELIADAYFGLGEAYFRQGKFAQAVDAYKQVLLKRPYDDDARYNLELSLRFLPTETPTVTPTTTVTDEVQDATATSTATPSPTMDSSEEDEQGTPTPSPRPENADDATPSPMAQTPTPQDEMSREEALQLLDDVQQGQGAIESQFSDVVGIGALPENDW